MVRQKNHGGKQKQSLFVCSFFFKFSFLNQHCLTLEFSPSFLSGDYLVDHSIVIYFHDDTGDLADCFTQSMRASDVVDKVVERMTFKPSY